MGSTLTPFLQRVAGAVSGAAAAFVQSCMVLWFDPADFDVAYDPNERPSGASADPGQASQGVIKVSLRSGAAGDVPIGRTIGAVFPLEVNGAASSDLSVDLTFTVAAASASNRGTMSSTDYSKLAAIAANAAALGTATPAKVSNGAGSAGSASTAAPIDHVHQIDPASGSAAGSMSSSDKNKLDTMLTQVVFFAGLRTSTSASPQTIGARILDAATDYPWSTTATLVVGLVVNTTGPAHADLYDQLGMSVLVTIDQATVATYQELTADVTALIIGQPPATLAVRVYTDAGDMAVTYAAIRFA